MTTLPPGLEPCAANAEPPVLHIRGDALPLLLAVVAAARAWRHERFPDKPAWLYLERAVDAYEAALSSAASTPTAPSPETLARMRAYLIHVVEGGVPYLSDVAREALRLLDGAPI